MSSNDNSSNNDIVYDKEYIKGILKLASYFIKKEEIFKKNTLDYSYHILDLNPKLIDKNLLKQLKLKILPLLHPDKYFCYEKYDSSIPHYCKIFSRAFDILAQTINNLKLNIDNIKNYPQLNSCNQTTIPYYFNYLDDDIKKKYFNGLLNQCEKKTISKATQRTIIASKYYNISSNDNSISQSYNQLISLLKDSKKKKNSIEIFSTDGINLINNTLSLTLETKNIIKVFKHNFTLRCFVLCPNIKNNNVDQLALLRRRICQYYEFEVKHISNYDQLVLLINDIVIFGSGKKFQYEFIWYVQSPSEMYLQFSSFVIELPPKQNLNLFNLQISYDIVTKLLQNPGFAKIYKIDTSLIDVQINQNLKTSKKIITYLNQFCDCITTAIVKSD